MNSCSFPTIDPEATGRNILNLRKERGLSVRDIQDYFNFEEPRAIYKWQTGQSLPSIDNLYALSALFEVPMDRIIVGAKSLPNPTVGPPPEREPGGAFLQLTGMTLSVILKNLLFKGVFPCPASCTVWASGQATRS